LATKRPEGEIERGSEVSVGVGEAKWAMKSEEYNTVDAGESRVQGSLYSSVKDACMSMGKQAPATW